MTTEKMEKHLDLMEMMVGHTKENGWKPVYRGGSEVLAEDVNREMVLSMQEINKSQAEKYLNLLQAENPDKQFDMQYGDSQMEDGSMFFWFIISEKI